MAAPPEPPRAPLADDERGGTELFQQPGAYPYPFGSACLAWLYEASDADLRGLPWPRLRDQAVAVDAVFAEYKGQYLAFRAVRNAQGLTPYLAEQLARTEATLRRIQVQQRRVRAILDAIPQPCGPRVLN
jgi:hypothetical protein